ncbi:hypothetical protein [Rhodoflexus sp.]
MTSLSAWCRVDPHGALGKNDTLGLLVAKQIKAAKVAIRGAYNPHRHQTNPASSHYGECMEVRIENNTDSTLCLILPCGTMLLSLDSSTQNMLVSETRYFMLAPRQKKYERINAMCGELNKNAPDVYVSYEVGKLAPEPLLRLAHTIEANSAQNKAGQYAVWAVTDKATKNELGEDYELLQASQKLLTMAGISFNIMGKPESAVAMAPSGNKVQATNPVSMTTMDKEETLATSTLNNTDGDNVVELPITEKEATVAFSSETNQEQTEIYQAPPSDRSELLVYLIGAAMLGLGMYMLNKKTIRRNA